MTYVTYHVNFALTVSIQLRLSKILFRFLEAELQLFTYAVLPAKSCLVM